MNLAAPLTDKANALECAAACNAVYDQCNLQTDDCHICVTEFDSCVRVDVRGSKTAQDWLNDLDFDFVDTIYGSVHHGFWKSTAPMFPMLKARLHGITKPIVMDGHSLGGGQVKLFAIGLAVEKFPIARVIDFGSPRTGDLQFQMLYDHVLGDKTIRFVNALDVVPRTPFSDLGYVHVGQAGYLPSTGPVQLNPLFYDLIHDDIINMVSSIRSGNIALLNDHFITAYQSRIQLL